MNNNGFRELMRRTNSQLMPSEAELSEYLEKVVTAWPRWIEGRHTQGGSTGFFGNPSAWEDAIIDRLDFWQYAERVEANKPKQAKPKRKVSYYQRNREAILARMKAKRDAKV
jgi:hypothetical protein